MCPSYGWHYDVCIDRSVETDIHGSPIVLLISHKHGVDGCSI